MSYKPYIQPNYRKRVSEIRIEGDYSDDVVVVIRRGGIGYRERRYSINTPLRMARAILALDILTGGTRSGYDIKRDLINYLVERHDADQRTIFALRADIQKYQNGEMPY